MDVRDDPLRGRATGSRRSPSTGPTAQRLSPAMVSELRDAYAAAEADDEVWTLVVTGNGRAFCTGADVGEIPDDGRVIYDEPYLSTYAQWEAPQEATPPFRSMTKPIVAAVNGICCGAGLDWSPPATSSIASDQAEFFDPHVSIGLVSGRESSGSPACCRPTSRCAWRSWAGTSA